MYVEEELIHCKALKGGDKLLLSCKLCASEGMEGKFSPNPIVWQPKPPLAYFIILMQTVIIFKYISQVSIAPSFLHCTSVSPFPHLIYNIKNILSLTEA